MLLHVGARRLDHATAQNPKIIHRDLKSQNVLLDDSMRCKLCDFGLAASEVSGQGTPCYMAPELLRNMKFDEKVDVFAFAVLLWEMFTRKRPYNGYAPVEIRRAVISGERLPIPGKVRSSSCP